MYKVPNEVINWLNQADISAATNDLAEECKKHVSDGESLEFYEGFVSAMYLAAQFSIILNFRQGELTFVTLAALAATEYKKEVTLESKESWIKLMNSTLESES